MTFMLTKDARGVAALTLISTHMVNAIGLRRARGDCPDQAFGSWGQQFAAG